ncbi:hypothetical protein EWJ91_10615 [Salmonella enterica subsp. enterica serovar Ouagadougou]|uniref:Uncharacterized protein n=1 Tax=Salmonella enterica subsp. enterica serovar Ouagadougou TaxID=2564899 RepID=A0A5I0D4D3_SALET|nr:hypothetical protein [Salmonella enterica subsp. enterica serovar Ouagadougou]EBP1709952.1 hypothetical protein [Salmonella enterica]ECB3359058.1 hypothetical protein [Salmonella enterica subsp. enterica serovar Redba]EBR9512418.1 hypothetical protein [Salmonella enterica subsp. enterica serovar Ouagadougou]EBV0635628.1 hypothetical protein [Salmonella enterica subsp. enterica serovar Ouagadougou]
MGEFINTLLSLISSNFFNKKSESEALEKFLLTFSQPNHDPRLVEYYFALATRHRYAKYHEIILMMNTRYPLATIWMYKSINRIQSVVQFTDDRAVEITSQTGWLAKSSLLVIDIFFATAFLLCTMWGANDISVIYNAIGHSEITFFMLCNAIGSGIGAMVSFLILSMTAYGWWEIINARPFVDYYNSHRSDTTGTN